ncbi:hypothetical protein STEG23_001923, partial [Scotinomys teguina]
MTTSMGNQNQEAVGDGETRGNVVVYHLHVTEDDDDVQKQEPSERSKDSKERTGDKGQ